jgi:histidine triad (HIT) family protein
MNNCIFCKIVDGIIDATKVYEDDDVLAFLDIMQTTPGHTLVISKNHHENFLSTPKLTMHKVMDIAQKIGQAQIRQLNAKGVNILTNNYRPAGQTVFHFHVHVIPRYTGADNLRIEMLQHSHLDELNLPVLAGRISKGLKED